ncbi:MAG TPA: class I SAM-dependent methyltransferase, partial [Pseudonocardia sp.]
MTDVQFTAEFWDERYQSAERVWSGNPNPWLVTEAADLVPGHALDAGCGEGADAQWLAGRGSTVTAADVSEVALHRAATHTGPDLADRITWLPADLLSWVPPARTYDLVSAHFIHFPSPLREPVFARLADAVRPGGTLLIVGHHPMDLTAAVHRPADPALYYTAEQLAAHLDPTEWT